MTGAFPIRSVLLLRNVRAILELRIFRLIEHNALSAELFVEVFSQLDQRLGEIGKAFEIGDATAPDFLSFDNIGPFLLQTKKLVSFELTNHGQVLFLIHWALTRDLLNLVL